MDGDQSGNGGMFFEGEEGRPRNTFDQGASVPKFAAWIMRMGMAKTPEQANYVLVGIGAVAVIAAIILFTVG